MTEDERTALVEEMAEAIHKTGVQVVATERTPWPMRTLVTACLPIIDRLLAAHDLDALLDSVPQPAPDMIELGGPDALRNYHIKVWAPPLPPPHRSHGQAMPVDRGWRGTGPTRLDALRDAVAKATGVGE